MEAEYSWILDAGLGVSLLILLAAFMKYGLPKILKLVQDAFQKMQGEFVVALERQEDRHNKRADEHRADLLAETARNREAQGDAVAAMKDNAVVMSQLTTSMENLRTDIKGLTGTFKRMPSARRKPLSAVESPD